VNRKEVNTERARRLWALCTADGERKYGMRVYDLAFMAARAGLGIPFDHKMPHWCIRWADGTWQTISGRSGCQATSRLFRILKRARKGKREWKSYATVS
jgi:hypothetical protein